MHAFLDQSLCPEGTRNLPQGRAIHQSPMNGEMWSPKGKAAEQTDKEAIGICYHGK